MIRDGAHVVAEVISPGGIHLAEDHLRFARGESMSLSDPL